MFHVNRASLCALPILLSATSGFADETTKGCHFVYRAAVVGERIAQQVVIHSDVQSTISQSDQVVSSEERRVRTEQLREITVLEADRQKSVMVQLTYRQARIIDSTQPDAIRTRPQAVANKSYIASRRRDELIVTYPDGTLPPRKELDIVEANMRSVGKPNPLALFLRDRTVQVGERMELPPELARELFGEKSAAESAQRITLDLQSLQTFDGAQFAVLEITMVTDDGEPQTGTLVVETSSCRTRSINLNTIVDTEVRRGPDGHTFLVTNRGTAHVSVQATYRVATRSKPAIRQPTR